jgi:hypothetical protein
MDPMPPLDGGGRDRRARGTLPERQNPGIHERGGQGDEEEEGNQTPHGGAVLPEGWLPTRVQATAESEWR